MRRRRPLTAARARIAEIQRELVVAHRSYKRCSGCNCTRLTRCVIAVRDPGGELVTAGLCAPAGSEPWLKRCSGCLTPELRVDPGAWKWAGPDELLMEDVPAKVAAAIAKAKAWLDTGAAP